MLQPMQLAYIFVFSLKLLAQKCNDSVGIYNVTHDRLSEIVLIAVQLGLWKLIELLESCWIRVSQKYIQIYISVSVQYISYLVPASNKMCETIG